MINFYIINYWQQWFFEEDIQISFLVFSKSSRYDYNIYRGTNFEIILLNFGIGLAFEPKRR